MWRPLGLCLYYDDSQCTAEHASDGDFDLFVDVGYGRHRQRGRRLELAAECELLPGRGLGNTTPTVTFTEHVHAKNDDDLRIYLPAY